MGSGTQGLSSGTLLLGLTWSKGAWEGNLTHGSRSRKDKLMIFL